MRWILAIWLLFTATAQAQVLEAEGSFAQDHWWGRSSVGLQVSEPVPWRLFTLTEPRRVVLEFQDTTPAGFSETAWDSKRITGVRLGEGQGGWLRVELELAVPMEVRSAGMEVAGRAMLTLDLRKTSAEAFAETAGGPDVPEQEAQPEESGPLVIALDPGHGGLDPGADRGGVQEADLMLSLALEIEAQLQAAGFKTMLTRRADEFVSLEDRMTRARSAGAGVFLSLHADALELDQAAGASVYTLNMQGVDQAAQRMAERHERSDLIQGADLSAQDDRVAGALMQMAQADTNTRSAALQAALVQGLADARARLNSRPKRSARLAVLMATDFPSVLIEAGFLSNPADRRALSSEEGRAAVVKGLVAGLIVWADADEIRSGLTFR